MAIFSTKTGMKFVNFMKVVNFALNVVNDMVQYP